MNAWRRVAPARPLCEALALSLLFAGCASVEMAPPRPAPDPHIERILDSTTQAEVDRETLFDRMAGADVIYLGELHDHPDHHRHQVEVIDAMIARGKRPAIGFERFTREETSYLMSFSQMSAQHDPAAVAHAENGLLHQLGFDGEEDPYWKFYQPKFERIRDHALTAFGADLPGALRNRIVMAGLGGLSAVERAQLIPSDLEDETYRHLMYREFKAGHCGYGPEPYLRKLYDTWLARNEAMADAIVETLESGERPVIFLTGNAHTRYDMGVVERVAHSMPGIVQINVGMGIVEPEPVPAQVYVAPTTFEGRDFGPEHAYVWLSRRHQPLQPDPCATFRTRQEDE